jgi:UDP-GlcNAc:undecaprenyl-phosphate GlcNAc-1-phosphate transferase
MNWFRATKNHLHHRLLELGFLHHEAVVIIYAIHGFYVVCGVLLCYQTDLMIITIYLTVAIAVFGMVTIAENTGWHAHTNRGNDFLFRRIVGTIRQHKVLSKVPVIGLSILVPATLIVSCFAISTVPRDFAITAGGLVVVMTLMYMVHRLDFPIVRRGIIYITATFLVYLFVKYPPDWIAIVPKLETVIFTILAIAAALAIRFSTDAFRVTPMDYLIMLAVLGIALSQGFTDINNDASMILIKAIIMIYACELLITIKPKKFYGLNLVSLFSLAVLSLRGLL